MAWHQSMSTFDHPSSGLQQVCSLGIARSHALLRLKSCHVFAGKSQEVMAKAAGFHKATHYEIGFGLMGVLVATKSE